MATQERTDLALMLMDLTMPPPDGYQATCRILAQPETRHIPVVGVAAHCDPRFRHHALTAGCL